MTMITPAFLIVAWLATILVCRHAPALGLLDRPNQRSSHHSITPHGGGLGIVAACCLLPITYFLHEQASSLILWIPGLALLMALTGLLDDLYSLNARTRLLLQGVVLMVLLSVLHQVSGHGLKAFATLSLWLSVPVLLFAGLWWLNLFNFMDGIDGIAATQAIFMLLSAAALVGLSTPLAHETAAWNWLVWLAVATAGFLLHNWPPARIFMGDTGSLFLAFMIFALALLTINEGWLDYPTWGILGAVFVADASFTLLRRLSTGQDWTAAHRSHAYQRLSRRWQSHRNVTLVALAINLAWVLPLAWSSLRWPDYAWLILVIAYLPLMAGIQWAGAGKPDHE